MFGHCGVLSVAQFICLLWNCGSVASVYCWNWYFISCSIFMKVDGLWDHDSLFYQLLTSYEDGGSVGSLFRILSVAPFSWKKCCNVGFTNSLMCIGNWGFMGLSPFDLTVNAWHFRWAVGEPIFWRRTFWLCPSHPGTRTSLKFSLLWREEFLQFSASWLLIVCLTLQGPLTWHIAPGASSHGVVLVNPFTFLSTLEYYLVLVHLDLHLE